MVFKMVLTFEKSLYLFNSLNKCQLVKNNVSFAKVQFDISILNWQVKHPGKRYRSMASVLEL